mmetsp:Transcript_21048/g.64987  ORF Transcript_21048/g.64987 Transcript_21048/m.64987 type:complete len:220 (+) Transcript_21048:25-684(+)
MIPDTPPGAITSCTQRRASELVLTKKKEERRGAPRPHSATTNELVVAGLVFFMFSAEVALVGVDFLLLEAGDDLAGTLGGVVEGAPVGVDFALVGVGRGRVVGAAADEVRERRAVLQALDVHLGPQRRRPHHVACARHRLGRQERVAERFIPELGRQQTHELALLLPRQHHLVERRVRKRLLRLLLRRCHPPALCDGENERSGNVSQRARANGGYDESA